MVELKNKARVRQTIITCGFSMLHIVCLNGSEVPDVFSFTNSTATYPSGSPSIGHRDLEKILTSPDVQFFDKAVALKLLVLKDSVGRTCIL